MEKIPEVKVHLADLKALYNAGYEVLTKLRKEANSPVVEAHFLNQEIIAIYGRNAAKIFYDKRFFKRSNAMPKPILRTLQGEGGVQTLDGEAHHKRKKIFMDLMTPERLDDYKRLLEKNLITALNKQQETFELYALTKDVLFKTICSWAGINLENYSRDKITELEDDQVAMFEGTVTSIPDHINGLTSRKNAEEWAQELIKNAREAPLETDKNLALYAFSTATDEKGDLLPLKTAAVDLLNIIRPTVAITVWIALMGHALFSQNNNYIALKTDFFKLQDSFINELRRYYPFFPMIPAISIDDVEIDSYLIPKESWVVLDIYGTNHDTRYMKDADDFRVDRYVGRTKEISYSEQYEMIAQGGGDFREMHRCAGEWITLQTLRVFSDQLVNNYKFDIPAQDWTIPMNQFPTYPRSKVLLSKV
ncbi:cytochrome P450 [Lactiplantibacillus pentosus]|uniref:cytochrome P450 n=1 Tax=Lactiplantibacillus pentosus TaxID=1589 RepID=UPI001B15BE81|nr:cytochrome P450 [Lactiplantibacillus pentosus]GIP71144.1 cytochrome P450 [Lactiplantibacillus pentosus]